MVACSGQLPGPGEVRPLVVAMWLLAIWALRFRQLRRGCEVSSQVFECNACWFDSCLCYLNRGGVIFYSPHELSDINKIIPTSFALLRLDGIQWRNHLAAGRAGPLTDH